MVEDPYKILGISCSASLKEIKAAYRFLAKKHHPDIGGDKEKILAINAAWELLRNVKKPSLYNTTKERTTKAVHNNFSTPKRKGSEKDKAITLWLKTVYNPIDQFMAEIISPLPEKLKELSADPYDDKLMEKFCIYIELSQKKIKKAQEVYQSMPTPIQLNHFSLSLYQCFAEIQDGINELERYTKGYVENYLHDGNEMLSKAKKKRLLLHQSRKQLSM